MKAKSTKNEGRRRASHTPTRPYTRSRAGAVAATNGGKKGGELMVEFTPTRTLPLTVNGRTIEVHAGAIARVPPEYKAVYDSAS